MNEFEKNQDKSQDGGKPAFDQFDKGQQEQQQFDQKGEPIEQSQKGEPIDQGQQEQGQARQDERQQR